MSVYVESLQEAKNLSDNKLFALVAYGSHIAGYARDESDYDFIGIAENFKPVVRYFYITLSDKSKASFLIVDKNVFEKDIAFSYLGDFVAGRLLAVYESLLNPEYMEKQDIIFKIRTLSEEIIWLKNEFDDFLIHLSIPLEYFLWSKLKKRMALYPPVKYSYKQTFFGINGDLNRSTSTQSFLKAAKHLSEKDILMLQNVSIKIKNTHSLEDNMLNIFRKFNGIYRGVKSYIIHGWAGQVGISNVLEEAKLKFKRKNSVGVLPIEFQKPYSVLSLGENGPFLSYEKKSIRKLINQVLGYTSKIEISKPSGIFSFLYKIDVKQNKVNKIFTYKKYTEIDRLKWMPVDFWVNRGGSFIIPPKARLSNEYKNLLLLKKLGFNAPNIIAVDWGTRAILREYIEGSTFSSLLTQKTTVVDKNKIMYELGKELATLHSYDICLMDAKPVNIILDKNGKIYFLDLEQATTGKDLSWDLSVIIFYGAKFPSDKNQAIQTSTSFIKGYLSKGKKINVENAFSNKNTRPFIPIVSPDTFTSLSNLYKNIFK